MRESGGLALRRIAVEFHIAKINHYFVTAHPEEACYFAAAGARSTAGALPGAGGAMYKPGSADAGSDNGESLPQPSICAQRDVSKPRGNGRCE